MKRLSCLVFVLALGAGCGSDPADVSGSYTIAITNRDNGCMLGNWNVGDMTSGIPVVITQDGDNVTADVMGLAAIGLDAALASHAFTGTVDGNDLDMKIVGTRPQQSGNCTFTYNANLRGSISGDALTGRVDYTAATNGNSDCAPLDGCKSSQDFNGTRPPR
jgi:hypothetical protein